jgi:hypothetical protein
MEATTPTAQPSGSESARDRDKVIHYTVNAEPQETTARKLTGRQILEHAGFTPAEEYVLTRNDGNKVIGLDDEEPIHEGEAFTAKFNGPTPVS